MTFGSSLLVYFDHNITDEVAMWAKFSYDYVSSASIDRLSNFPEQSGASGDFYFGVDGGLRLKLSESVQLGGFVSGSVATVEATSDSETSSVNDNRLCRLRSNSNSKFWLDIFSVEWSTDWNGQICV